MSARVREGGMKSLTRPQAVTGVVALVIAAVIAVVVGYEVSKSSDPVEGAEASSLVVRPDSHRLDEAADGKATLVEFLDFECEGCLAAYPFVEGLRERYAGKVTFVARYFPMPGHKNSRTSAHAVEAAARQGKFEAMYAKMYETQTSWGEQQKSQAPLFRTFAEELDLDMAQYDRDVVSTSVAERVQSDFDDGRAAGVTGTPTFFLNGERLRPTSEQEFYDAIDAALAD